MLLKTVVSQSVAALSVAALLAGCATRPADIAPTYVSEAGYRAMTCGQLAEEAQVVSQRAAAATGAQSQAVKQDAVLTTVGVLIFWPAILFNKGDGPRAAELARLKGEMNAIENVSRMKNCGITFQQAPVAAQG